LSDSKILLGFEVGSGKEVQMRLHHTVVTGMTQLSGKTTTLEAIISRSGRRAIAFKTKRGEEGFNAYEEILPFFNERADWQYVASLLEATLREKLKFERPWIMRATKGARTLREVMENIAMLKAESSGGSLPENIYTALEEYLKIVVPQIERFQFSKTLELKDGINVMDLTEMSVELQSLVIRSTMEHVISELRDVIVIIPEAWEHLPQGRNTPVKLYAETFIRKGASVGNFLFIDSQDIAGVDKTPLRQCNNWILGRQREANEVERVREILGRNRFSAEDIRGLPLGHFYAVLGDELKKVYVLPAGVPYKLGRRVATGEVPVEKIKDYLESPLEESKPKGRQVPVGDASPKAPSGLKEKIGSLGDILPIGRDRDKEREAPQSSRRIEELEDKLARREAEVTTLRDEVALLRRELEKTAAKVARLEAATVQNVLSAKGAGGEISVDDINLIVDARMHQILQFDRPTQFVSIDVSKRLKEAVKEKFVRDMAARIRVLPRDMLVLAMVVREKGEVKRGELYSLVYGSSGRIPEEFYEELQRLEEAHLVLYSKATGAIKWTMDSYVDAELKEFADDDTRTQVKEYLASVMLPTTS
jgi:uncharacterized coiled-coil protein SlyX